MGLSLELNVLNCTLWVDTSKSALVTDLINIVACTKDGNSEALEEDKESLVRNTFAFSSMTSPHRTLLTSCSS